MSGAASLGFLFAIGASGIHWGFALALLAGGLIAVPLAAYLIKIALAHLLGVAVGGMILLTNSYALQRLRCLRFRQIPAYIAILLVTAASL